MKIGIIVGPGHHHQTMMNAFKQRKLAFRYALYWPHLQVYEVNAKGEERLIYRSQFYDLVSKILWSIWHRLPVKRKKRDLELWLRFFRYAKLYSTNALIGGYRARTLNQKSLEGMDAYIKEAEISILKEIKGLHTSDNKRLKLIKFFNSTFMRIPFVRTSGPANRLKNKLYEFPPIIKYSGKEQSFVLKELS